MNKFLTISILATLFIAFACDKEDELKEEKKPLNSFSMNLNDQPWQPSIIDNDPCFSAFHCAYSELNNEPFYTIKAYKDSKSRTDQNSEHIFIFQIMNVNDKGVYNISDSYGGLNSYAMFIKNESGRQTIYENRVEGNTPIVEVEEIILIEGFGFKGLKGSFKGILYNKIDANDSIVIDSCDFDFKKVNWNNYCQCAE